MQNKMVEVGQRVLWHGGADGNQDSHRDCRYSTIAGQREKVTYKTPMRE